MHSKGSPYQSFLMRLWKDGEGRRRIMLERITPPNDRFYFTSLDELFAFLLKNQAVDPEPPGDDVQDPL